MMNEITSAIEKLGATQTADDAWAYYDAGTQRWYLTDANELRILAELLASDDEDERNDAYSHWCAATTANEMPAGWTPEVAS